MESLYQRDLAYVQATTWRVLQVDWRDPLVPSAAADI